MSLLDDIFKKKDSKSEEETFLINYNNIYLNMNGNIDKGIIEEFFSNNSSLLTKEFILKNIENGNENFLVLADIYLNQIESYSEVVDFKEALNESFYKLVNTKISDYNDEISSSWDDDYGYFVSPLKFNKGTLELIPKYLLEDRNNLTLLGSSINGAFNVFPKDVFKDEDYIIDILNKYYNNYDKLPTELPKEFYDMANNEFLNKLIDRNPKILMSLVRDEKFYPAIVEDEQNFDKFFKINAYIFNYLPEEKRNDKDFCLELINKNHNVYKCLNDDFKRDLDFICIFVDNLDKGSIDIYKVNDILKEEMKSREFCLDVIDRGYLEFCRYMPDEYKKDTEIILKIVDTFEKFDASLDFDLKRIAPYPSRLFETLEGVDFKKERSLLNEKNLDVQNILVERHKAIEEEGVRKFLEENPAAKEAIEETTSLSL